MLADWCSHRSAACPPGIAEEDFEELEGTHLRPDARLGPAGGNRHRTVRLRASGPTLRYEPVCSPQCQQGDGWESLIADAPLHNVAVPNVEYTQVVITPELMVMGGIKHQPDPFKLVVKMSSSQSAGVSNAWSKTVLITPGMEDGWLPGFISRLSEWSLYRARRFSSRRIGWIPPPVSPALKQEIRS